MSRLFTYFRLQCKRFFRLFPFVLLLTLLLSAVMGIAAYGMITQSPENDNNRVVRIGVVGDMSDSYLEMGLAAAREMDATRFSVEFVTADEKTAGEMLGRGELSAYLIVPDNFARNAVHGDIGKLTYVSSAGTVDFGTKITNDLLTSIGEVVINAQKAVYGFQDAAAASGVKAKTVDAMGTDLAHRLIALILSRAELYAVEEIGTDGSRTAQESLVCGLITMFFMLWGITCCTVFAVNKTQISRVLCAKGFGPLRQVCGEYGAYFIFMMAAFALLIGGAFAASAFLPGSVTESIVPASPAAFIAGLIPAMLALSAMQFFLYELTFGLISGVLLQFLCAVGMGYVTGCMYPVYFFPEAVQEAGRYLPSGAARLVAAYAAQGQVYSPGLIALAAYFVVFIGASALTRRAHNNAMGGGV